MFRLRSKKSAASPLMLILGIFPYRVQLPYCEMPETHVQSAVSSPADQPANSQHQLSHMEWEESS
jgi:hypothetical protein